LVSFDIALSRFIMIYLTSPHSISVHLS
jgi:hypothetical protein